MPFSQQILPGEGRMLDQGWFHLRALFSADPAGERGVVLPPFLLLISVHSFQQILPCDEGRCECASLSVPSVQQILLSVKTARCCVFYPCSLQADQAK